MNQKRIAPVLGNTGLLTYKLVERKHPFTKQPKLYAQKTETRPVDFESLINEVAYSTSMTPTEVSGVLLAVGTRAVEYLKQGRSVDLGALGSMHTTILSGGALTAKEWKTELIRNVMVRWVRPTSWREVFNPKNNKIVFVNQTPDTTADTTEP